MKYGIMGGTFNPIHWGHLRIAEVARERLNLDQVIFIPSANPPHKNLSDVIDANQRYDMCLLATQAHPDFVVSRLEIDRQGPSYTYDTVSFLKQSLHENDEIYFIIGADMLLDLINWHRAADLMQECSFIAISRKGFRLSEILQSSPFLQKHGDKLHLFEIPYLDISSTMIRQKIAAGLSVRYLTPDCVWNYIVKHQLFTEGRERIANS